MAACTQPYHLGEKMWIHGVRHNTLQYNTSITSKLSAEPRHTSNIFCFVCVVFFVWFQMCVWVTPGLSVGRKGLPLSSWIICPATGLKKSNTSSGRGINCRNWHRPFRPLNSGWFWTKENTDTKHDSHVIISAICYYCFMFWTSYTWSSEVLVAYNHATVVEGG